LPAASPLLGRLCRGRLVTLAFIAIEFRSPLTRRRSETGSVCRRAATSVPPAPIEVSFRANDGASSSRMIRSISAKPALRSVAVSKGTAPISNSYKRTPSEYTSELSSTSPVTVSACSGLAYSGVPTIWPNCVSKSSLPPTCRWPWRYRNRLPWGLARRPVPSPAHSTASGRGGSHLLVRMLDRTADREE
jgi:hypothetical protein